MARIPHVGGTNATFGNRGPDRPTAFNPDTSGMDAPARAVQGLAATVGGVAQDHGQQQQREAAERLAEGQAMGRAKAANASVRDQNRIEMILGDIESKVADKSLSYLGVQEEFERQSREIEEEQIPELAPADRERYKGAIQSNRMVGAGRVKQLYETARRQEGSVVYDSGLDEFSKQAGAPGADIEKINAKADALLPLAIEMGLNPVTATAKLQAFKDNNWTNQAKARLLTSRNDLDQLTRLESDLAEENGFYAGKLDTDKRNAIWSQVLTAKGELERRTLHDTDKIEAAAERAILGMREQIATGVPAPVDYVLQVREKVRGTTFAAEFDELLAGQVEIQRVRQMSPEAQANYVQALQAEQQRDGATKQDQGVLRTIQTTLENDAKQLREAPLLAYSSTTGRMVAPLDMSALTAGDVAAVSSQIAERQDILATLRKQRGPNAGDAVLLPQEASALTGALGKANPAQAVKLFGTLRQVFNDPAAYRSAMQQIAPDSPVKGEAGRIYALQRPAGHGDGAINSASLNGQYGDVALAMLRGEALLNPGKAAKDEDGKGGAFKMPPPTDFERQIGSSLKGAFAGRPEEYATALQGIRAYYASKAADAGDMTGLINSNLLGQSIKAVVGEKVRIEGREVVPPWGMSGSQFRDIADTYVHARLKEAGIENPGDVALVNVRGRPGYYGLQRGIEPMVDPRLDRNGNPIPLMIRIEPSR